MQSTLRWRIITKKWSSSYRSWLVPVTRVFFLCCSSGGIIPKGGFDEIFRLPELVHFYFILSFLNSVEMNRIVNGRELHDAWITFDWTVSVICLGCSTKSPVCISVPAVKSVVAYRCMEQGIRGSRKDVSSLAWASDLWCRCSSAFMGQRWKDSLVLRFSQTLSPPWKCPSTLILSLF